MTPARREEAFKALRQRVARNLKKLRGVRGLTQVEIAKRSGVYWRHIQKVEAAETNLTLKTMGRLADALSVDVTRLMAPAKHTRGAGRPAESRSKKAHAKKVH